jgi:ABC-2 type transport system ATP-binding protein
LKKLVSGSDTIVLELEIANLTTNLISSIQSLENISFVSQENSTHVRVNAAGEEAFDNIIDTVRAGKGKICSVKNLEPTLEDVFLQITGHEVRDVADQKIPTRKRRHLMPRSRVR